MALGAPRGACRGMVVGVDAGSTDGVYVDDRCMTGHVAIG
jgi:hypothetical protein